jgi:hypothetical protein
MRNKESEIRAGGPRPMEIVAFLTCPFLGAVLSSLASRTVSFSWRLVAASYILFALSVVVVFLVVRLLDRIPRGKLSGLLTVVVFLSGPVGLAALQLALEDILQIRMTVIGTALALAVFVHWKLRAQSRRLS